MVPARSRISRFTRWAGGASDWPAKGALRWSGSAVFSMGWSLLMFWNMGFWGIKRRKTLVIFFVISPRTMVIFHWIEPQKKNGGFTGIFLHHLWHFFEVLTCFNQHKSAHLIDKCCLMMCFGNHTLYLGWSSTKPQVSLIRLRAAWHKNLMAVIFFVGPFFGV